MPEISYCSVPKSAMSEIITLSSDDEENAPPRKRLKAIRLGPHSKNETNSCIILSDDDDDLLIHPDPAPKASESAPVSRIEDSPTNRSHIETVDIAIEDTAESPKDQETEEIPEAPATADSPIITAEGNGVSENGVASPSGGDNIKAKLFDFLDECLNLLQRSKHLEKLTQKLPVIRKYYKKLVDLETSFVELEAIIESKKDQLNNPKVAFLYFVDILQWLRSETKRLETERLNSGQNDLKTAKIIKSLEVALVRIRRKIAKLDEAEVDFDDEENSHYMKAARYKQRATQIYKKLCQYQNEDPNFGRLLYCRLDFSASRYPEINHAINKKYKNNLVFPSYADFNKCVRKCVEVKQVAISEENLKYEIKHCFETLGNLLQKRRKKDLLDHHNDVVPQTSRDPALDDPTIDCKLRAHRLEHTAQLNEIMRKYVHKQETGVDPQVSSDSDDSAVVDSDSEPEESG